jgi:hypothetical protein
MREVLTGAIQFYVRLRRALDMPRLHWLPLALICSSLGCAPEAEPETTPVPVRQADTLDPRDLGIGKYVFEARVPADKVMVLRRTEEQNGREHGMVYETIQSSAAGGRLQQVVLVLDSSAFPFSEGKNDRVRVRAQAGELVFNNRRCTRWAMDVGLLILEFTNDAKDKDKLTYQCFVEDYEAAKKRVPNLPALSKVERWSFNATLGKE